MAPRLVILNPEQVAKLERFYGDAFHLSDWPIIGDGPLVGAPMTRRGVRQLAEALDAIEGLEKLTERAEKAAAELERLRRS